MNDDDNFKFLMKGIELKAIYVELVLQPICSKIHIKFFFRVAPVLQKEGVYPVEFEKKIISAGVPELQRLHIFSFIIILLQSQRNN
jgi:hypothetical protein